MTIDRYLQIIAYEPNLPGPSAVFYKYSFIETQSYSFVCVITVCFCSTVETETVYTTKPKIFTIYPLANTAIDNQLQI